MYDLDHLIKDMNLLTQIFDDFLYTHFLILDIFLTRNIAEGTGWRMGDKKRFTNAKLPRNLPHSKGAAVPVKDEYSVILAAVVKSGCIDIHPTLRMKGASSPRKVDPIRNRIRAKGFSLSGSWYTHHVED